MAAEPTKDTIYIDIDDEITAVIDKVRASNAKVIALVLPKRASVLQSIVNMKLLKRSADAAKKNLVLVTTEAGLLPLAGVVGLYVAKTPQSKPEIPASADSDDDEISDGSVDDEEITVENSGDKPVGDLSAASSAAAVDATPAAAESATAVPSRGRASAPVADNIETLQMEDDLTGADDDSSAESAAAKIPVVAVTKPPKAKKDHKLAVPNFDKFRLRLVFGVLLLVLLGGAYYVATAILPKATVTISTYSSNINSALSLTLDANAKTLDSTKLVVPAQVQQLQKTGTQQAAASGKQNNGNKASGNVTVTNCDSDDVTIPAGTGFTANGYTYISQKSVTIPDSNFSSPGSGSKCKNDGKASVPVTAQAGGANYNLSSGSTVKVVGYSLLGGVNDDITGGTDNIVQVVTQSDIDDATKKIVAQNSDAIKQQLAQQLQQAGMFAVTSTFTAGDPQTTATAKAGDQVATVTVNQVTNYTMFGVKKSDLKTLVDNDAGKHIDSSKQSILDEGLDHAVFKQNSVSGKTAQVALSTAVVAGPDLKTDTVKSQIAGKKAGDIKSILKANPGVSDVKVQFSPFWVTSAPDKPAKLTVIFQKANGSGQ